MRPETLYYRAVLLLLPFTLTSGMIIAQPPLPGRVELDYPFIPERAITLPQRVKETSGLICTDSAFWTFNDSGGKPEIYKIRPGDGEIVQTVVLEGASNRDWEDICQDDEYIYTGDFGNNQGTRKDLRIFKIAKKEITDKPELVIPYETIFISYSDQAAFTDSNRNHDFDCESMVSFGDELILFSKNWVNGKTRMYKVPKTPGIFSVSPSDEFEANGLVTGADFNNASNMLILIGYSNFIPFIYIFRDFKGDRLNGTIHQRINFTGMGGVQSEGICFTGDGTIAISAEQTKNHNPSIYLLDIEEVLLKGQVKK
jgi:hypothetical protein